MNSKTLIILTFLASLFHLLYSLESNDILHTRLDPENILDKYNFLKKSRQLVTDFFQPYTKTQQAYLSIFIINSAIIPIFLVLYLYKINSKHSEYLSSFSAGCIIGDVFLHNLPEFISEKAEISQNRDLGIVLCFGILFFYISDKLIGILLYYTKENKLSFQKIIIITMGDILHNFNDGLAITSAFIVNINLGVILTIFHYFHEFPQKLGDFSLMLKQKMELKNIVSVQVFIGLASFIGVYTCLCFNEERALQILSFSSGGFLYLSINTVFSDIKEIKGVWDLILTFISCVMGIYFLLMLA